MTSQSQYDSSIIYGVGQQVILGGIVYQAILAVPVQTPPPNGTYWEIVAVPQSPLGGEYIASFPFTFAKGSAALAAGIPTGIILNEGDRIVGAWFAVTAAFNGTTPLADVGTFSSTQGLFKVLNSAAVDLTVADAAVSNNTGIDKIGAAQLLNEAGMPLRVTADGTALTLVVSETGAKGGTAAGATAGSAVLHVRVLPAAAAA
jgi:hypothetical protein